MAAPVWFCSFPNLASLIDWWLGVVTLDWDPLDFRRRRTLAFFTPFQFSDVEEVADYTYSQGARKKTCILSGTFR